MTRRRDRKKRSWHPEEIKAAVRMRGETLTGLATKNDLKEDACRDALRTRRPAAEEVIAAFIEVPKEELWPDRYGNGSPSTDVDTATQAEAHRLIGEGR
jgi:Ner family transcriptional regulator